MKTYKDEKKKKKKKQPKKKKNFFFSFFSALEMLIAFVGSFAWTLPRHADRKIGYFYLKHKLPVLNFFLTLFLHYLSATKSTDFYLIVWKPLCIFPHDIAFFYLTCVFFDTASNYLQENVFQIVFGS